MAEDDPKVDVEVSVQDSASGVLKQIVKEIDIVTRKMVEAGVKGSEAFEKIKRGGRGGKDEMDRGNKSLASMSEIMTNMGKAMLGPAGLAAGVYAVGVALHSFATQRVQLQAMTADIGFTAEKITQVKRIIGSMTGDFSGAKAESFLTNIGGALKELQTLDVNSPLFSMLTAWNETDFANELLDLTRSGPGGIDAALEKLIEKFEEMSRRNPARAHLFATELLRVQPSILLGWKKAAQDIELVQKKSLEESIIYLREIEKAHNVLNTAMGATFNTIFSGLMGLNKAYEFIAPIAAKYLGGTPAGYLATEKSPDIIDENQRIEQGLPPLTQGPTQRQHGGPAYSGRPYVVGESGPELFVPSQSGQVMANASPSPVMRELVEQERESNKALDDIVTALKQIDDMQGGFGGPMGFGGRTGGPVSTGGGQIGSGGGASMGPGSTGALGGTVHGYAVDAYAGQTGQKLFDPMTGTLGGGLGGHSAMFGPGQHMGLDIMGKRGSTVHAIKDGVIVKVPERGGGIDQTLIVRHQDGTYTRYLHQGYLPGMYKGKPVSGGEVIGSSGYRNADHSHVEFWVGEPGARGSKLGNLRAIMGYDSKNLPVGGQARIGRGPAIPGAPTYAGQEGVPGSPLVPGQGGAVAPAAVNRRLMELIQGSGLVGYLPHDAAKYGMKTGSAAEWAALMTGIAGKESSYNTGAVGDIGAFVGGSRGLFQLSPQDAVTYGLQSTPFTHEQLADPEFNARMAVKIAAIRARKGGIGGPEGMAKYWRGPITSGGVSARVAASPPQGTPTVSPSPVGAKQTAATGALTPSQQFIAAKTKEEADAAMARSRTDWSRDMVNKGLASDGSLLRTGKVSASVDFAGMPRSYADTLQPFLKLEQAVMPQGNPVNAGMSKPGTDSSYGQWVP